MYNIYIIHTYIYSVCVCVYVEKQEKNQQLLNCDGARKTCNFLKRSALPQKIYTHLYILLEKHMANNLQHWSSGACSLRSVDSECVSLDCYSSVEIISFFLFRNKFGKGFPKTCVCGKALPYLLPALFLLLGNSVCKRQPRYYWIWLGVALLDFVGRVWRPRKLCVAATSHWPDLEEEFRQSPSQCSHELYLQVLHLASVTSSVFLFGIVSTWSVCLVHFISVGQEATSCFRLYCLIS